MKYMIFIFWFCIKRKPDLGNELLAPSTYRVKTIPKNVLGRFNVTNKFTVVNPVKYGI